MKTSHFIAQFNITLVILLFFGALASNADSSILNAEGARLIEQIRESHRQTEELKAAVWTEPAECEDSDCIRVAHGYMLAFRARDNYTNELIGQAHRVIEPRAKRTEALRSFLRDQRGLRPRVYRSGIHVGRSASDDYVVFHGRYEERFDRLCSNESEIYFMDDFSLKISLQTGQVLELLDRRLANCGRH